PGGGVTLCPIALTAACDASNSRPQRRPGCTGRASPRSWPLPSSLRGSPGTWHLRIPTTMAPQRPATVTGGSAGAGGGAGKPMRQLAKRLQRLESTGTFVDFHRSFNRLVHEAALEVDLPPACRQQLATAVDARLHTLSQSLPASFTHERQID